MRPFGPIIVFIGNYRLNLALLAEDATFIDWDREKGNLHRLNLALLAEDATV